MSLNAEHEFGSDAAVLETAKALSSSRFTASLVGEMPSATTYERKSASALKIPALSETPLSFNTTFTPPVSAATLDHGDDEFIAPKRVLYVHRQEVRVTVSRGAIRVYEAIASHPHVTVKRVNQYAEKGAIQLGRDHLAYNKKRNGLTLTFATTENGDPLRRLKRVLSDSFCDMAGVRLSDTLLTGCELYAVVPLALVDALRHHMPAGFRSVRAKRSETKTTLFLLRDAHGRELVAYHVKASATGAYVRFARVELRLHDDNGLSSAAVREGADSLARMVAPVVLAEKPERWRGTPFRHRVDGKRPLSKILREAAKGFRMPDESKPVEHVVGFPKGRLTTVMTSDNDACNGDDAVDWCAMKAYEAAKLGYHVRWHDNYKPDSTPAFLEDEVDLSKREFDSLDCFMAERRPDIVFTLGLPEGEDVNSIRQVYERYGTALVVVEPPVRGMLLQRLVRDEAQHIVVQAGRLRSHDRIGLPKPKYIPRLVQDLMDEQSAP